MINYPSYYSNVMGMPQMPSYIPQQQNENPNSLMEPNPSFPPFADYNMDRSNFAQGGQVLSQFANYLSSLGEGEDKILAHINPEEAQELNYKYGSDINPLTGLPQYGFFKKVKKSLKKAPKSLKNVVRVVGPVGGAILGSALGGPLGGAIGGGLGGGLGSVVGGGKNPLLDVGLGALGGYTLGPATYKGIMGLGGGLGTASTGFSSGLKESLGPLGLFGSSAIPTGAKALGTSAKNQQTAVPEGSESPTGNMLNNILLGTAVLGTAFGKHEYPSQKRKSVMDISTNAPKWEQKDQSHHINPFERQMRKINPDYTYGFAPEEEFFEPYAEGGFVEGFSGGQDDDVYIDELPVDSYVLDANTVAQLGDGNSFAGARALDQTFGRNPLLQMGMPKGKSIKARISTGEYVLSPQQVQSLGKGNITKGVRKLDSLVKNVRKHKGFTGFPPKSKSVMTYLNHGGRSR